MKKTMLLSIFIFFTIISLSSCSSPRLDIFIAAKNNDVTTIKKELQNGVDVNAKNKENLTPLIVAIKNNSFKAVKFLVENGADIELGFYEKRPLHFACEYGFRNIIKYLLENGADINSKSFLNWTPLHYVTWKGYIDIVTYLVMHGANLDDRISKYASIFKNHTALMIAKKQKNFEDLRLVRYLGDDTEYDGNNAKSDREKYFIRKEYTKEDIEDRLYYFNYIRSLDKK